MDRNDLNVDQIWKNVRQNVRPNSKKCRLKSVVFVYIIIIAMTSIKKPKQLRQCGINLTTIILHAKKMAKKWALKRRLLCAGYKIAENDYMAQHKLLKRKLKKTFMLLQRKGKYCLIVYNSFMNDICLLYRDKTEQFNDGQF